MEGSQADNRYLCLFEEQQLAYQLKILGADRQLVQPIGKTDCVEYKQYTPIGLWGIPQIFLRRCFPETESKLLILFICRSMRSRKRSDLFDRLIFVQARCRHPRR